MRKRKSLALIGSASAEKARRKTWIPGRGTFDKGDLKEAAGGADDYGAASWVWYGWVCPMGRGDDAEAVVDTAEDGRERVAREVEREKQVVMWCFQAGRHTRATARGRT